MQLSRHFTDDEFRCKCGCGALKLHPGFIEALQIVREEFGLPMTVTSGCRCKAHNDMPAAQGGAGGHPRSLHICDEPQHPGQNGTLAADIATPDGAYRGRLMFFAWKHGFSVGFGRGFLHLDRRGLIGLKQTTFDY